MEAKEQTQWFWEQCGFKIAWSDAYGSTGWEDPNGHYCFDLPMDIDLNTLFQYAVPKLDYWNVGSSGDSQYAGWARIKGGICQLAIWDNPALALFWAIYKALGEIEGNKDGEKQWKTLTK